MQQGAQFGDRRCAGLGVGGQIGGLVAVPSTVVATTVAFRIVIAEQGGLDLDGSTR